MLKPLGDRVVLKIEEKEEKAAGSLSLVSCSDLQDSQL